MDKREEGEGLCQLILRSLGKKLGPPVLFLILLWLLLYSAFVLRSGADRIITTIYPNSSPPIFCISMGLLGFAAAAGAARSLVRVGKIVLPVVLGALLLVASVVMLLFGMDKTDPWVRYTCLAGVCLLPLGWIGILAASRRRSQAALVAEQKKQ